jgi:hypothetical protein
VLIDGTIARRVREGAADSGAAGATTLQPTSVA